PNAEADCEPSAYRQRRPAPDVADHQIRRHAQSRHPALTGRGGKSTRPARHGAIGRRDIERSGHRVTGHKGGCTVETQVKKHERRPARTSKGEFMILRLRVLLVAAAVLVAFGTWAGAQVFSRTPVNP